MLVFLNVNLHFTHKLFYLYDIVSSFLELFLVKHGFTQYKSLALELVFVTRVFYVLSFHIV